MAGTDKDIVAAVKAAVLGSLLKRGLLTPFEKKEFELAKNLG